MPTATYAIVAHSQHDWRYEEVHVRDPKDDELLVEMIASGICHTDIAGLGDAYPRVLGHEGSGYVKQVGSAVTVAEVGDPVLLSFDSCGQCRACKAEHPAYCDTFGLLNMGANDPTFKLGDTDLGGPYFGQSSFAKLSIVKQRSVVNAKAMNISLHELKMLCPLGCGVQTGSGSIINVAKATANDTVAVSGCGGVGLSGIMAAAMLGCKKVIAIDLHESRLELAKSMGATHTINISKLDSLEGLPKAVADLTDGVGVDVCLDTTGRKSMPPLELTALASMGRLVCVGSPHPDEPQFELPAVVMVLGGKQIMGAIEGDATPQDYVPKMVEWWRAGKFPVDKMIKHFGAEEAVDVRAKMEAGDVVKGVIVW